MQLPDQKSFLRNKDKEVLAFFVISRIFAIFASAVFISDVGDYQKYAQNIISLGLMPYADFSFQYPPLSLLPIYFSGIFLSEIYYKSYLIIFSCLMMAIDFSCLALCRKYCQNHLKFNLSQVNYMTLLYSLFGALLFALIYHRLDMVIAFLLISLVALSLNKEKSYSFFALSIGGFFYKVVTVFMAPLAIILQSFALRKQKKEALLQIIKISLIYLSLLAILLITIDFIFSQKLIINIFNPQDQGIHIQSLYGSILLLANSTLATNFEISYNYGIFSISSSVFFEALSKILVWLAIIAFYVSLVFSLYEKKDKKIIFDSYLFLEGCLVVMMIILSLHRVLTPQLFIWIIPLISIYLTKNSSKFIFGSFLAIFVATFYLYHFDASDLAAEELLKIIVLFCRNIILVILTANLTTSFFKKL